MPHETSGGKLTAERLRSVIDYDADAGIFRWKVEPRGGLLGKVAGCVHQLHGYRVIRIDGFLYKASRLAWLYVTGEWPLGLIDHIDGLRANDAFANLRQATSQQNNSNKKFSSSKSGFKGVFPLRDGRFGARITVARKPIHLGHFDDPIDAARAYNAGANLFFGEFARLNQL